MKTKKFLYSTLLMTMGVGALVITSCTDNREADPLNIIKGGEQVIVDIPSDEKADPNPQLPDQANTTIPNLNYSTETQGGKTIIRMDMTGIQDPQQRDAWLYLYGTDYSRQNIWLEIDDQPKGFTVHNTVDDASTDQHAQVDLVFLVDNSGSMSEEADAIANDIISWSNELARTLDMRFACVGYDMDGYVNGGMDFNDAAHLSSFLNRPNYNYGTSRTMGFADQAFSSVANTFSHMYDSKGYVRDEDGVMALRFAHEKYSFRPGANRVYVNFTDEPNQPNGNTEWSVNWVKDTQNWATTSGTVHTVFSESGYGSWSDLYYEQPWLLSEYTGGTTIFTSSDFRDVSLSSLPVTGALQNSYYLRLTNVDDLFDGQEHKVKVTVLSPDKSVRAEREFYVVFQ